MYEQEPITKAAIIGLGAIGSYLASHLQTVLGDNLRIIAGGARKERLERDGVVVNGKRLHFHVVDPQEDCGGDYPQLAIIITKFSGLPQAIKDIKNQIGPHTIIMAPLNGVEKEEIVAASYGWENLLYSLARVSVVMRDGKVTFSDVSAQMEFGEKHNETLSPRVQAVKALFESAGIKSVVPEDMERAIWLKYMCNVSENQSAAVLGIPFGAWNVSDDANWIREALVREVAAVAAKKGIRITEEDIEEQGKRLKNVPAANKPSTLQDLEAGRKTEVDMFAGTMMRLGKEYGVPTPYNELFYHAIRVLEQKNDRLF